MSKEERQLKIFQRGFTGNITSVYKDPFSEIYLGNPGKITKTQKEIWPYMKTRGSKTFLVGGKGCGKTIVGAALLIEKGQQFRGGKFFIAAATKQQAFDSCAAEIIRVATIMNVKFEFKKEVVIERLPHENTYIFPEYQFYICIRSAENISTIEGSQWDGCVIEEMENKGWTEEKVSVALSRLRRGIGDHFSCLVAMPSDEDHWMYSFVKRNGYSCKQISTMENEHNLPPDYIPNLLKLYPGKKGKRYILGEPVSLSSIPVFDDFDSDIHQKSNIARMGCKYDMYRRIILSYDFNVYPICVSVWQVKPWYFGEDEIKNCLFQIDEFQNFSGGTPAISKAIYKKYREHSHGITIIGDATGNATRPSDPSKTDWTVIASVFKNMKNCVIIRGLINKRLKKRSLRRIAKGSGDDMINWENPPLKDSIIICGSILSNDKDIAQVYFLEKSNLEGGGVAASVRRLSYKAEGKINDDVDKKEDRNITRTHFAATFRYVAWYVTGGKSSDVHERTYTMRGVVSSNSKWRVFEKSGRIF